MKDDFFATSQNCFQLRDFPLRSNFLLRTARKIAFRSAAIFCFAIFRSAHYFSRSLGIAIAFPRKIARSLQLRKIDFRSALFFSVARNRYCFSSQPRKIGCGSENKNKHSLFLFSLSFVFSRFESKLSSGFQLRIKNQLNLFLSSLAFHYFCTPFEGNLFSKCILVRRIA